ncbi:large ribosomal subunit protein cL37-like [Vicia villosa]|uniref:large ribosomal subunit protein cL37-like n=1 Tax=Vicia villosa TaxID=3911 RepID=UPI00273C1072|nr:large ribosomal subunit protein cL37-like [Vicia villosa]
MALLCFNSFTLTPLSSSSSSISPHPTASPISRVQIGVPTNCLKGVRISTPIVVNPRKNAIFIASAAAGDDDASVADAVEGSESKKESGVVSVDKLPLESKLKEREEQKARMKLAKKKRLRRKRLVQKRRLRKKGNWPPSKMKKLKNV